MEDQISATDMALKAFAKLKEVNPEHELVKLLSSEGVTDEEFYNRFWDKKEPWQKEPGSMVSTYVEVKYFLEVQKVLKEEYEIEI